MSDKTTLKAIKAMPCTDVTDYDYTACTNLRNTESGFVQLYYSAGIYGCNGMVLQGNATGTLYKIAGRKIALFILY